MSNLNLEVIACPKWKKSNILQGILIEIGISQHNIQMPKRLSKIALVQRTGKTWPILKEKVSQQMPAKNYLDIEILR